MIESQIPKAQLSEGAVIAGARSWIVVIAVALLVTCAIVAGFGLHSVSYADELTAAQVGLDDQQSTNDEIQPSKIDISHATVKAPARRKATGFAVKPKVSVICDGKKLVKGVDYSVSYAHNKKPGKATITIKGKGAYKGTVEKHFKITGKYDPLILVLDKSLSNASGVMSYLKSCGCRTVYTRTIKVNINKYDGLAIPGGGDVDPIFYGEKNTKSNHIHTWLDKAQFKLIKKFARADKPVLGICRGAQVINVAYGGSLYQHVSGHSGPMSTKIKKGSWMYDMFGGKFTAFHGHHQAVKKLGKGLVATQWTWKYGIRTIEMVEHEKYPVFGIQYHPEMMGKAGVKIGRKYRAECLKRL